jgi:hypothetical protein
LPFEGGLFKLPDGELVIKLNSENSYVRKRFTLAHEIGHLLLDTIPARRSARRIDDALERTCDLIAAELLMPMEEMNRLVRKLGAPSPEKLKAIASEYKVSLRATAIRVHSGLRLWKCYIGFWEKRDIIRTAWFVGQKRWDATVPSSYSIEQAADSDTSVETTERWERQGFSEPVGLNLLRVGMIENFGVQRFLGLVTFLS